MNRYDQTFSKGEADIVACRGLIEKYINERNIEVERIKEIAANAQTMKTLQALHNKSTSLSKSFRKRIINQVLRDQHRFDSWISDIQWIR